MKDYIQLANRTAAGTVHPVNKDLLHCAMGLCTEVIELEMAYGVENYDEEMGDIMWYVALGCHTLGVTLDEAEEARGNTAGEMIETAGEFMNQMKREMFYGKQADPNVLVRMLGTLIYQVKELTEDDYVMILEKNIAKLQKRYPDKFTEDRAINR